MLHKPCATFADLLQQRAADQAAQHAYTFLLDGETSETTLTYGELDRHARRIAAALQQFAAPGERALLLYPPGLEYVAAFFGCLYAGIIAIPAYPPNPARLERTFPRLRAMIQDAQPAFALTLEAIKPLSEAAFAQDAAGAGLPWIATDSLTVGLEETWRKPELPSDPAAFLQYTSGSTSSPKGVIVTHANLLHNCALIYQYFGHSEQSCGVIWLPPYHDMGLIGGILQPLYGGFPVTLMSPLDFLQRPIRWLQAISRYRATTSGGPNFAYDLCVRKVAPDQRAALDLSSWDLAFNGAEPIHSATLHRFAEAFAASGFRASAFYPCYGLAEATLIVSGATKGQTPTLRSFEGAGLAKHQVVPTPADNPSSRTLVGCGATSPDQQIVIVHPETRTLCSPDQVGEIWVQGPSVARGYWGQAAETAAAFQASLSTGQPGTYLRTGDLGFLLDEQLFITGRLKEVIIIRGRNYYPHDIERTVEQAHPALRPGGGAAFATADLERLVIVHELDRTYRESDHSLIIQAIRQAVAEESGVRPDGVVLIRHGTLPKTSSGKTQRYACRERWQAGQLTVIAQSSFTPDPSASLDPTLTQATLLAAPAEARQGLMESYLLHQLAALIGQEPESLDPSQRLSGLGLDSMMGIETQHGIEANFGVSLSLTVFLNDTTIAQLAGQIIMALASAGSHPAQAAEQGAILPGDELSYGQRALWFLQQLAPNNTAYNIARAARIQAELRIDALQWALRLLVERHPMLRTTFPHENGTPHRRLREDTPITIQHERVTGLNDAALYERLSAEAHRPFNLEQDALLRLYLFSRSDREHVLLLVAHHIVLDFWSLAVFIQELSHLYTQEQTGAPAVLAVQPAQYDEHVRRQREMLAGPEGTRLWAYWRQQLAGDLPLLNLPTDYERPAAQTFDGAEQSRRLPAQLTLALKELSRARGATLYMTLLAAWQVWLARVTDQEDVLVGSLATGRQSVDMAHVVGYFVEPIVLRADLRNNPPFGLFLEQTRQTVLAAFAHQGFPFALLTERLQPNRDPSRAPLFQVLFTMQQAPFGNDLALAPFSLNQPGGRLELGGITCESLPIAQHVAQFDLTLAVADTADSLGMTLQYNRDLFAAATIAGFLDQFQALLEGIVRDPARPIADLPLLGASEQRRILLDWNTTEVHFPEQARLHDLLETQTLRTPDRIALVFEEHCLTYAELDARANQLAQHLKGYGIGPDMLVGLCIDRSLEMMIGLLGILKAGGAYVPLDPNYPADRLEYILQDTGLRVLLTATTDHRPFDFAQGRRSTTNEAEDRGSRMEDGSLDAHQKRSSIFDPSSSTGLVVSGRSSVVDLLADWPRIAQELRVAPGSSARSGNLAYVIYTSGSTGRPKGVGISHSAVVNFLESMRQAPGIASRDHVLAVTTLSFDIAVLELLLPLVVGARVVLPGRETVVDGAKLAALIDECGATLMQATPATWRMLLELGWAGNPHLTVLCGGEALPLELATRLLPRSAALWNMYGPTETTIWSASAQIAPKQQLVTIGRPIANTQIYILNARLQPAPVGVAGDLYIAGAGLARGYLGRPDLTAERFIPNPFAPTTDDRRPTTENGNDGRWSVVGGQWSVGGERMYKTGDLARWRPDGSIECLGRVDQQVKIRGFRIELGEIEAVLAQHADVRQVAVVARENTAGDRRLVAYIIPTTNHRPLTTDSFDTVTRRQCDKVTVPVEDAILSPLHPVTLSELSVAGELRAFLKDRLPDYMIPAAFVVLDALPLTPNGKVDRRVLLELAPQTSMGAPDRAAPRSHIEHSIAAIWQEVLQVEQVGVNDNFFDLGGHSLLLAQVHNRLRQHLNAELSMVDLFKYPTISALAERLQQASPVTTPHTRQASRHPALVDRQKADIAIIGMAGRFPGAPDIETFWENLRGGVESITFFTDQELLTAGIAPTLLNDPNYVKAQAALPGIELFDAEFFGIHAREAASMDPQHRLFIECAWHALEHAGYDSERYQDRIGLYAGVGMNTYLLHVDHQGLESVGMYQAFIGNDKDFVPTRVSYKLNLRGPSVNVQTACSSSLVAVHLACSSLLNGECDIALAGGVAIRVPQTSGYLYETGGILSPDGHCRPFDARALGTVFGSGVGIVALKRLADALSEGDTIHAVIKGSAINNDGAAKIGYTAPSVAGQAAVIADALAAAQVPPETIQYVETHGTGTPLGDPIEIAALNQTYGAGVERGGAYALGSVKANIGHLDTAAGIAGLIKTVLALRHHQIPPSLHFEQPNPQIDFATSPFQVNTALSAWPRGATPRRAAVSSFGIGGTNAHIILEEAPSSAPASVLRPWNVLLLSAKTNTAVEALTANLAGQLRRFPDLNMDHIAYTLQVGRRALSHRRALVYRDRAEALEILESRDPARMLAAVADAQKRTVVFMFPGQGAQYAGMGHDLYESEPVFRATIDRCAELLRPHLGLDLRNILYSDDRRPTTDDRQLESAHPFSADGGQRSVVGGRELDQTWLAQPALFVIEYALAQLWIAWGVRPSALIGHSIGEYVAACLAGVISLEDALVLVAARGRMMQQLPGGAMLSVVMSETDLRQALEAARQAGIGPLDLAAINGPAQNVVAGTYEAISTFEAQLKAQGIVCRAVRTSHAFHSQLMDPIVAPFTEQVGRIRLSAPRIPYISNLSGDWMSADEATDPSYWARHLRQPVRFGPGIEQLVAADEGILLEVGPGHTLSTFVRQLAADRTVITSMRHAQDRQPDEASIFGAANRLWLAGADLDYAAWYAPEQRRRIALPIYPFERQRYWIDSTAPAPEQTPARRRDRQRADIADWFAIPVWKSSALPARPAPARPTTWLVFMDDDGLTERVVARLRERREDVIQVRIGPAFRQIDGGSYEVNPQQQEGYDSLAANLPRQNPVQIIHCWSLKARGYQAGDHPSALDRGFTSLLYLAKAIGNQKPDFPIGLSIIANNIHEVVGGDLLDPEAATIIGPYLVIPREYPNLSCRLIDIDLPPVGSRQEQQLADHLLAEAHMQAANQVIAYRGGRRWIQLFEPLPLGRVDAPIGLLRPGGVYLITGGMGGIGMQLAAYFARTVQARLVLVGRSAFPERHLWDEWPATHEQHVPWSRHIRAIQEMKALGAEVLICQADVADETAMRAVLAQAERRFGPINGVIHAAGIAGGGMIQFRAAQAETAIWAPKVRGSQVVAKLFESAPLDFLILLSSLNTVVGRLGQVDYTAANAFLDAFAQYHQSRTGTPTIAINWDAWGQVGMAARLNGTGEAVLQESGHARGAGAHDSIAPHEGIEAFARILFAGIAPRVIVSIQDIETARAQSDSFVHEQILGATGAQDALKPGRHSRPHITTVYVAPETVLEQRIAEVWQDVLGIDRVGIHDNFFELGGSSLTAIQIVAQIERELEIQIPPAAIFEGTSIQALARLLDPAKVEKAAYRERQSRGAERRNRVLEHHKRRS